MLWSYFLHSNMSSYWFWAFKKIKWILMDTSVCFKQRDVYKRQAQNWKTSNSWRRSIRHLLQLFIAREHFKETILLMCNLHPRLITCPDVDRVNFIVESKFLLYFSVANSIWALIWTFFPTYLQTDGYLNVKQSVIPASVSCLLVTYPDTYVASFLMYVWKHTRTRTCLLYTSRCV